MLKKDGNTRRSREKQGEGKSIREEWVEEDASRNQRGNRDRMGKKTGSRAGRTECGAGKRKRQEGNQGGGTGVGERAVRWQEEMRKREENRGT